MLRMVILGLFLSSRSCIFVFSRFYCILSHSVGENATGQKKEKKQEISVNGCQNACFG